MPSPRRLALCLLTALAAGGTGIPAPGAESGPRHAVAPSTLSAAEATALLGKSVTTRDGHPAGAIRDFTLAGPGGRVEHAVVASGGLLGIGASLVLVPADRLRVEAATSLPGPGEAPPVTVKIDLSAAELAELPAFAGDGSVRTLSTGR